MLAALGIVRDVPVGNELPTGAIARVEGSLILREDYLRLVSGYESDTRRPSDRETRRHILDRMIEEELLIARALELGLGHLDRKVRADLTSGLIASIVSEFDEREPSESELRRHYEENQAYFAIPGRLRVRQMSFSETAREPDAASSASPAARADDARSRLSAGEAWERVKRDLATPDVFPLPDAMLPAQKLREYLGPSVVQAAMALEVGELSEPIQSGTGLHLVDVLDREATRTPSLSEIREQLASDWRRRQGDLALRRYIDDLRADADVLIAEDLAGE